ncbi:glycosyltransferase BC10-like [Rosa sericea]
MLPSTQLKKGGAWRPQLLKDFMVMSKSRSRSQMKRPRWIIALVCILCVFLITAYFYPSESSTTCYLFSSPNCDGIFGKTPPSPARELTDDETASSVVVKEILNTPPLQSKNPKIAFMFLTPGTLPFEELWENFFQGHEDKFSVYVHASKQKPIHVSRYFVDRDIHSEQMPLIINYQVVWGKFSMVEAEKRLLANALLDPDNQHFVLLSDSCIPLHSFDYVYNYLMYTNVSFIDCFVDPGPHGTGRYAEQMMPEVEKHEFRKGSQWFTMKRQHAIVMMADSLYYTKFKLHCRPNMDGRNCYSDEHYLPTFFRMKDPAGLANWSVTFVDWSEGKWHPRAFRNQDVTYDLLRNITSIADSTHVTSDATKTVLRTPCLWNGMKRPCFLFARKFYPETLGKLIHLFSNYTKV